MADKSAIEWTEATWNPVVGCSIVSPGCTHCYAMALAGRIERMGAAKYAGLTHQVKGRDVWNGTVRLDKEAILQPLRWRKPRRIFVNSMSDLFHEGLPDEAIDRVWAVMALCPQHTFQVLTKRSERMRAYLTDPDLNSRLSAALGNMLDGDWIWNEGKRFRNRIERMISVFLGEEEDDEGHATHHDDPMPLPNVWLGVSAEDQDRANERIPALLETPAAVRWLSIEPLLGPVDLRPFGLRVHHHPDNVPSPALSVIVRAARKRLADQDGTGTLDWVVVGGESGPNARPMHPDWARSIRDQCEAAGVPFFFKQWGGHRILFERDAEDPDWKRCDSVARKHPGGRWLNLAGGHGFHGDRVVYVVSSAKATSGRDLDGRTWDGMPA